MTVESHTARSPIAELFGRLRSIDCAELAPSIGAVSGVSSDRFTVQGLSHSVTLNDRVSIHTRTGPEPATVMQAGTIDCVVVPFRRRHCISIGDLVSTSGYSAVKPTASWCGRVIDGLGQPVDGAGPLDNGAASYAVRQQPLDPLRRQRIQRGISTGVSALDVFVPLCAGQRIGLFAGSGVGKSTLLSMIARHSSASVIVIALIGERGREVRDFLDDALGPFRHRVVAVVATSDESPLMQCQAPAVASCVAEYFRDQGHDVLLIMDSLTRFAHARRDLGIASGEPPVARGYPPSVFREMAALLERAGPGYGDGSITLIATVLVDGDDHNDPIADAVRGVMDGHVVLERSIAQSGRWPAIDLLASLSRLSTLALDPERLTIAQQARTLIASYEASRDLRALGEYRRGLDSAMDHAVDAVPDIYRVIEQFPNARTVDDPFQSIQRAINRSHR